MEIGTEGPVRTIRWRAEDGAEPLIEREWLVSNGLGGFASGTISGVATRRYHGMLVAALPAPLGRVVMMSHLLDEVAFPDGRVVRVGAHETADGATEPAWTCCLREFRLEMGLPVWTYEVDGHVLEKRVTMVHEQNTVHVGYRLLEGREKLRLRLRPSV